MIKCGSNADTEYKFIVSVGCEGMRVDRFLAQESSLSRTFVSTLIKNGKVRVQTAGTIGDRTVYYPSYNVLLGERFFLHVPNTQKIDLGDLVGENIPVSCVYEDQYFLVVDKPAGMLVYPTSQHNSGTIVNMLLYRYGRGCYNIGGQGRCGIAHRLDKDTTGILVIAKNEEVFFNILKQFKDRTIFKTYIAFVWGTVLPVTGEWVDYIGRHPTNRLLRAVVRQDGKIATTRYRVISSYNQVVSLLYLYPKTGRTHQLRVQTKYHGVPIVGDKVYKTNVKCYLKLLSDVVCQYITNSVCRHMLHASAISFMHPVLCKKIDLVCDLPNDMQSFQALLVV